MLSLAILLFGITSILGIYLSSLVLRNKPSSQPVILIHGLCSISGFAILISYWPASLCSILLFAVATICGLILLYEDITGKPFTRWLCYAHGIITIAGFVALLVFALHL